MFTRGQRMRRITIRRVAAERPDGFGGTLQEFDDLATVSAEVETISDGERWRALQVAATVTHRFRIRWGVGVTILDRVRFEGREFEISGVKELDRRAGQEITAVARAE